MSHINKRRVAKWSTEFIGYQGSKFAILIIPDGFDVRLAIDELNEFLEFVFYVLIETGIVLENSTLYFEYTALEELLSKLLEE